MTFTLTIELGNDAMRTKFDLCKALNAVGHRIINTGNGLFVKADGAKILDANGNSVGQWEVK